MTRKDIEDTLKRLLVEEMEIDESKVYNDASLKKDMGIDSLDYVDILVIVDREFGFKIKPEEMSDVKSFFDLCNYVESKIS